ncbi:MAG: FdhF/YdeP family oxidoreductase [Acidobacteriaceae bacterium]
MSSNPSAEISHIPVLRRHAQPPIETSNIKIGERVEVAAGIEAIEKTLEFISEEPGFLRGTAALYRLNQFNGYDCPGCAWPDPDEHRSANEYCENGAKAIAEETTTRRVDPGFFRKWSVSALSEKSDHWLGKSGRLTHPMFLREGSDHYEPISWQNAFDLIAEELNSLASPDEAIFYTSGRTSNEAAFLYQLFVREYGTNNLPDCSNMCHESSGAALSEVIGIGKGTVTLHDFDHADTIFIIGQNPGTNHPRMLSTLAHAARRGAKIISVNPLSETGVTRFKHPQEVLHILGSGTKIASHFVQLRNNGDLAFFKGICKEMLEAEARTPGSVLNHAFLAEKTAGFDDFRHEVEAASWDEIIEQSGIPREQIREIAEIVMASKAMISCWAMGITQQKQGVACIREITNMHLMGGHIGRQGAGLCPVRGHSNVQGDRTMGIWEKMPDSFLDRIQQVCGFQPLRKHGWDAVDSIRAMHRGEGKVFFAMGGNFLSATPDTQFTAEALSRCNLTVHVSTKLNRSHLITGKRALILPCLGRTEEDKQAAGNQFVTVENSMGIVSMSHGRLSPASEHLMSEPAIIAHLAATTFKHRPAAQRSSLDWLSLANDYDRIRDLIAQVVPGCDGYNQKVRHRGGFYLPNAARDNQFHTKSGKANFTANPIEPLHLEPDQFVLMTIRTHDQYNTTIYGLDDRYRGIFHGRRVVLLNPEDMQQHGWEEGQRLDITSHFATPLGDETRLAPSFLAVPYEIPRHCAATYFPEANVLVHIDSTVPGSNTPTSKSIIVTFAPSLVSDGVIENEGVLMGAEA